MYMNTITLINRYIEVPLPIDNSCFSLLRILCDTMDVIIRSIFIFLISAYALFDETTGSRPIYTIQSEDGDVIDCIYVHEQPALFHPLLKDHKIQMRPSHYPANPMEKKNVGSSKIEQTWQKSGKCPYGTIPTLRKQNNMHNDLTIPSIFNTENAFGGNARQEEASGYAINHGFYTSTAGDLYIYNETVEPNEFSLSYVAVGATNSKWDKRAFPYQIAKSLSAGYMAYPSFFGDSRPRIFVLLRNENAGTVCLNLECGFIQTINSYLIGGALNTISKIGDINQQFYLRTEIYLDNSTNNWWLRLMDIDIGYWPRTILDGLVYGDMLKWGGLVLNTMPGGYHTTTTMGSGLFPNLGWSKSGAVANINFASMNVYGGRQSLVNSDGSIVTRPGCYDYAGTSRTGFPYGFAMLYGGHGGPYCDYRI